MKALKYFICLTVLLSSCGDKSELLFPKSTFDSPFPKSNRDLTKVLGNFLRIKSGTDTLEWNISFTNNNNLITDSKTGDTLFSGKVCKFRGLYYFNQQLNDTSYWIYAVKLNDNLVYGLNSAWAQTLLIDREIEKGKYNKMVIYIADDKIRLHPDKKEFKQLYTAIIDSIIPDTILEFNKSNITDTTNSITQINADEFEFIQNIYPNPAKDYVNIDLHQNSNIKFHLKDKVGKTVLHGQFTAIKNKIDLSGLPSGIYYVTLINAANKQKEIAKIIKVD